MLKRLKLYREYIFHGSYEELQTSFEQLKKPRTTRVNESTFKVRPLISLGTLIVYGFGKSIDGINVLASTQSIDENRQQVTFTTKIRTKHYFFIFVFGFITIISFSAKDSPPITLVLGLWIVFHLWFQLVYRVQEKIVMEKVADKLKLTEQ